MENINKENPFSFDRLIYRRQYVLGPEPFLPNKLWSCLKLDNNYILSIHCDLPYTHLEYNGNSVLLIGYVFDPYNPQSEEKEIISSLIINSSDLFTLIQIFFNQKL